MSNCLSHCALAVLGWTGLLLALPLAFLAIVHEPNKYAATPQLEALDCDGPTRTYLLVLTALLVYATGFLVNVRRWRRRSNLAAAVLCFTICAAVVTNAYRAVGEERRQVAACRSG